MISAGEVGAVFRIDDQATQVITQLAEEFNKLQVVIDKIKESIGTIGNTDGGLAKLAEQLKLTGTSGEDAGRIISESFVKVDGSIDTVKTKLAELRTSLAETAAVSREVSFNVPGTGGGGMIGGHPSTGGPHEMSGSHLIAGAAKGLGATGAGELLTGNTAMIGGAVIAEGAKHMFENGADWDQIRNRLRIMNVDPAEIAKDEDAARQVAHKYGLPQNEVLAQMTEIALPLNKGNTNTTGMEAAREHIDKLAQSMAILRSVMTQEKSGEMGGEMYDLVKSAEFRNAVGPDFDMAIDGMTRSIAASGGKVTPQSWFETSKYARGALPQLSNRFLYGMAPEFQQEFGGSSAGTVLSSLYQGVYANQLSLHSLREEDRLGLFDEDKVERDSKGQVKSVRPGANKLAPLFSTDPDLAMQQLKQIMVDHGIITEQDQRAEVADIFRNRNAAQAAGQLMFNMPQFLRGERGIEGTQTGEDAFNTVKDGDPWFGWNSLKNNFLNGMTDLGSGVAGGAGGAMQWLADRGWAGGNRIGTGPNGNLLEAGDVHAQPSRPVTPVPVHIVSATPGAAAAPAVQATAPDMHSHPYEGRDPRSPQTGPFAYAPPPAPAVTVNATGNMTATFGSITANFGNLGMLVGNIANAVAGKISGQLKSGMSAPSGTGFNSGAHAPTPDMGPYGPSY